MCDDVTASVTPDESNPPSLMFPRTSTCDLEVDVWVDDILNPSYATQSATGSQGKRAAAANSRIQAVPSLRALWEVHKLFWNGIVVSVTC